MINYFNFKKFGDWYLITNDLGRYMFLSDDEFDLLVHDRIDYSSEVGSVLVDNLFCYDGSMLAFSERLKPYYRDMKSYLFTSTSLHIFVLTNMCNTNCVYCQAHPYERGISGKMAEKVAKKAVDIAMASPNRQLSFEFQGGEPLINYEVLKFIVEYSESRSKECNKEIEYNLVSNLSLLTDDMTEFFKEHHVSVSTSVDGDCYLHNKNRPMNNGIGSYEPLNCGVRKLINQDMRYGAIQTTTQYSLLRSKEIVDEYVKRGLDCVFIRSLTPLGCANANWNEIGYTADGFLRFYKDCLDYIIEINEKGYFLKESYASLLLNKILKCYSLNYMELRSPCGAGIGQIAYNYDGNVYTCDEGRMLAEMGDDSFKLGTVDNTYDELINSEACKSVCVSSVIESIPGCSECVYSPYCCKCPVINFSSEGSLYNRDVDDYKCSINRGILDLIFEYLQDSKKKAIFESWVN